MAKSDTPIIFVIMLAFAFGMVLATLIIVTLTPPIQLSQETADEICFWKVAGVNEALAPKAFSNDGRLICKVPKIKSNIEIQHG